MKAMTREQRDEFERDGYLVIRHALKLGDVRRLRLAIDSVYRQRQALGRLGPDRSLRLADATEHVAELADLVNHPATFGLVWSTLGWNAQVHHSHLDVCPQVIGRRAAHWHRHCDDAQERREGDAREHREADGQERREGDGQERRDDARGRRESGPGQDQPTSVRLRYCLSDVSEIGRGNLVVLPGSHRTATPAEQPDAEGRLTTVPDKVVYLTTRPGDVIFCDSRLWTAHSINYSPFVNTGVCFGYTAQR